MTLLPSREIRLMARGVFGLLAAYSGDRERTDRLIVITQIGDRERVRMSLDGVSVSVRLFLPSGRPL